MLTLIEDIINLSEPEKQDENQISEKNFYNVSDSELKFLQRVRFWIKFFTTRQILNKKIHEASEFEEKILLKSTILKKKSNFKKNDFEEKYVFKKHDFEKKYIFEKQILKKVLLTENHVLTHFTP